MKTRSVLLLVSVIAFVGCASAASTATKVVAEVGKAQKLAASVGHDAHLVEVEKLVAEFKAKRLELGCGVAGPPPYPEGCRDAEWVEYRDAGRVKLDAAKARYATFVLANRTLHTALVETALGIEVYLETREGFDLAASISALVRAWAELAALLTEYGVDVPTLGPITRKAVP